MSAEFEKNDRGDLFSKPVRAGKRTYFFDVKSTKAQDYYLTITESKKRFGEDGEKPFYEKHKIFLYKEDFEKFTEGLNEVVNFIQNNSNDGTHSNSSDVTDSSSSQPSRFSDVDFDDLGETK